MLGARMRSNPFFVGVAFFLIFLSPAVLADVTLPKLLSSGMVLQRGVELKIWGWAEPEEKVSLALNNVMRSTAANTQGRWQVTLPAMMAGGPFTIKIRGNNQLKLEDVWVGDVWLASGQSNMELTLARAEPRFPTLVANINNRHIRQFNVPDRYDFKNERMDFEDGQWRAATQDNIRQFSAVAYFFAEQIQRKEQVPIGIINASLGGAPVEAWMSEAALKPFPEPYQEAQRFRNDHLIEEITRSDEARAKAWFAGLNQKDHGYDEGKYLWAVPELSTEAWQSAHIPGYWADNEVAAEDGVVWFRKTINVPRHLAQQKSLLVLGTIVDADQVFVNGSLVGQTTYMYPPRRYEVPSGTLQPGENAITIRVTSQQGLGGFVPDKEYALRFPNHTVELAGQWQFKRGATMPSLAPPTFIRWKPQGLYNAMIAPLKTYPIKGVIWYQGESNAGNADAYRERFPAMITDWRKQWQQPDLPFLFVQLANYVSPGASRDQQGNWPELREAQLQALALADTAMVVSIDAGEWNDIHPLDKKTIGERLAAAAQSVAYGHDVAHSGPILRSAKRMGSRAILAFDYVDGGLEYQGEALNGFTVAGADGEFHRANAKIKNNQVVVWSDAVAKPSAVRYAWANNPEDANLYNKEGFPASPFQTFIKETIKATSNSSKTRSSH